MDSITQKNSDSAPLMKSAPRKRFDDNWFNANLSSQNYDYSLFSRGGAKKRKFTKVSFVGCIFDKCYFNHCEFDSCDFTGCRFESVNFEGSNFSGCNFEYCIFEKTNIDRHVLTREFPQKENLKARFARSMRLNYMQLGDSDSANIAIGIELEATRAYLYNAWKSPATYYRNKYKGLDRFIKFIEWTSFKLQDFIWGNGESILKLIRTFLIFFSAITAINFSRSNKFNFEQLLKNLSESPGIAFGISVKDSLLTTLETAIAISIRFALFGLLMAIVVRRFSRR